VSPRFDTLGTNRRSPSSSLDPRKGGASVAGSGLPAVPRAAEHGLVDLVCGPASPLPETYQRYRLVARLGSGGQADVYRGVRLCGGVTSAPITVKVFRIDPRRPLADELRSWDKGDAALMDLNNRGVIGICRRADGFYGPPPHASGVAPNVRDAVPYQIYDYLHGINLREYITGRAGLSGGSRLVASTALHQLAATVTALHHPADIGACPVLHMDIKPSNIMTLTNGEIRLIDFTGARYWRHEEITQIAYTPESGGPEALQGQVGPSYDVHGFGSVAFFMLAGSPPRGQHAPPMARHPLFDGRPALRDHLLAPLADRPSDRPATAELTAWVDRLLKLVRVTGVPDLGLDWAEPRVAPADASRVVGRARPVLAGTETDAFSRIEMLERELVALRANGPTEPEAQLGLLPFTAPPPAPSATPSPAPGNGMPPAPGNGMPPAPGNGMPSASGNGGSAAASAPVSSPAHASAGNSAPTSGGPSGDRSMLVGRAAVVTRPPSDPTGSGYLDGSGEGGGRQGPGPPPPARVRGDRRRRLKRGGTWSVIGVSFSLVCWIIWAASNRARGIYVAPAAYAGTLAVALGVFVVLRLLGQLVIEGWMHKVRRGATGAHFGVAVFLIAVGITYLEQTTWLANAFKWL
jgi:serine/threonine protein kinase